MTEEQLDQYYSAQMKFYAHIFVWYKFFIIDQIQTHMIKTPEKLLATLDQIFEKGCPKELFSLPDAYIEANLYPHFVVPLTTVKGKAVFSEFNNGSRNVKEILSLGLETTKQKELGDNYIHDKALELIAIKF